MTNLANFGFLALFTMMLAAGQVLFKKIGLSIRQESLVDGLLLAAREPTLYAALALYGCATLLWIWILSRVPLSQAYPWVAGGVALVPLLGCWFFGEQIRPTFWLGVVLIILGIGVTQHSFIGQ